MQGAGGGGGARRPPARAIARLPVHSARAGPGSWQPSPLRTHLAFYAREGREKVINLHPGYISNHLNNPARQTAPTRMLSSLFSLQSASCRFPSPTASTLHGVPATSEPPPSSAPLTPTFSLRPPQYGPG